jgi:hypothetical protein
MKQLTSLILFFFIAFSVTAQTTPSCEVAVAALKGTYEGECSKGKANGEGTATGTDTYKGTFKNGYPEGTGKYTWKNGDYYFGNWKKGVKEGKGEMHTMINGKDSVLTGYWKKDVYSSEYEHPFKIYSTTTEIGRVEVSKIKKDGTSIQIEVENSIAANNSIASSAIQTTMSNSGLKTTGGDAPAGNVFAKLTDMQVTTGSYMSKSTTTLSNKEVTIMQGVVFPFRATMSFGNSRLDIELFENGTWSISVPIGK